MSSTSNFTWPFYFFLFECHWWVFCRRNARLTQLQNFIPGIYDEFICNILVFSDWFSMGIHRSIQFLNSDLYQWPLKSRVIITHYHELAEVNSPFNYFLFSYVLSIFMLSNGNAIAFAPGKRIISKSF